MVGLDFNANPRRCIFLAVRCKSTTLSVLGLAVLSTKRSFQSMADVADSQGGVKEVGAIRDWSELTPVCLSNIFRRLTLEDRWKGVMLVCRSWLDAARDPSLFSTLDLEPAFEAAGSGQPDAAEWWTRAFQWRVDLMLRFSAVWADGALREVRVRHCSDEALCFASGR